MLLLLVLSNLVFMSKCHAFVVPASVTVLRRNELEQQSHPHGSSSLVSSSSTPSSSSFSSSCSCTKSRLSMGLLDIFFTDPEKQKERQREKRRLIEEQERLQKQILERRQNPDKMEEYEQKTQLRRQLKMQGNFEEAAQVDVYEGYQRQTLLNGRQNSDGTATTTTSSTTTTSATSTADDEDDDTEGN